MQFLINTSIWFQEWVRLFVNDAEKNSKLGQIWQDIKNPIKMKHSPVIHVTLLPINTKRSVYEHSDRVHSSVLYPCDQCAKSFTCKQNLKIHAKIHYISEKAFTWKLDI